MEAKSLQPGFRLRAEGMALRAADLFRWAARQEGRASLWLPELGVSLGLGPGALPNHPAWARYVARLADELPPSLSVNATFPAEVVPNGVAVAEHFFRWPQVMALRTWGIGFAGTPRAIDQIERRLFEDAIFRLVTRARGAAKVFRQGTYDPRWLPGLVAEPLERLIYDVLNEQGPAASLASLSEDFLEKTDLRVRHRDVERRRGSRVQISWSVTEASFNRKAEAVRLKEEYVFVAPITIAKELGVTTEQVIGCLRHALRHPDLDPRGPLALVPDEWRAAIREMVHREAMAATERLRAREQSVADRRGSGDDQ